MSRFDYIAYDEKAKAQQAELKAKASELETLILSLSQGRPTALALTKLEEVYMWAGKAIRDEQLVRNGVSIKK